MMLCDFGARLLGTHSAAILRVASLYEDGATVATVSEIIGIGDEEGRAAAEGLVDAGVLQWIDDRVRINFSSPVWRGLMTLLDLEVRLLRDLSRIAADLTGDSTRVALYGGERRGEGDSIVIIEPENAHSSRLSILDQVTMMINGPSATFHQLASDGDILRVRGDTTTQAIRRWLTAEDTEKELDLESDLLHSLRMIEIDRVLNIRRSASDVAGP